MTMKVRKHDPQVKPSDEGGPVSVPEAATEIISKNITCSYGIHRGNFPIAGMKGKDARAVLKKLIKVDDSAAMVINGEVFNENEIIQESVKMVSFVKPSAVKGGETITIEGRYVKLDSKKCDIDQFCGVVAKNTVSGLDKDPIPDNVKWIVRSGPLEVYILELKPELRRVKWVNETAGPKQSAKQDECGYSHRKLATPYVVMSVPFYGGQLHPNLELYYRNLPLTSLDDQLYHCNLLNVSMGKRVAGQSGFKTWVCTQYLNTGACKSTADILSEIISHVFGGGFNRSSDNCEGGSGFSTYEANRGVDLRVKDVNKWEQASEKDPRFVLDVDWIKADATPRDLINFRMKQFNTVEAPQTSKAIGNILLASKFLV